MKIALLTVLLLAGLVTLGADTPAPSKAPPARITGVCAAKDGRTLVIRYELLGRSYEQKVTFTNEISDFRYCRWLGEQGIAIVANTRPDEFYYAALFLTGRDIPVAVAKIPAPTGKNRLLGIANTGGDSIVITAVQHRRNGRDTPLGNDRLSGWMFIDNCPPGGGAIGWVVPFDIPGEQSGNTK